MTPLISMIVAMDENRLIGENNQLPWHMPADLAFFKRTTMGKPILMGRKTWESIGRALPGRRNIVISRNTSYVASGADVTASLEDAIALCEGEQEIMLIGGATLYEQCLAATDNLYITRIHHTFEGDTWFPDFNQYQWKIEFQEDYDADEANPYPYSFIKFCKEN